MYQTEDQIETKLQLNRTSEDREEAIESDKCKQENDTTLTMNIHVKSLNLL